MSRRYLFYLPDGSRVEGLNLGVEDGPPSHNITADAAMKAVNDAEFWKARYDESQKLLATEKRRIERLMAALAGELTGSEKSK